MLSGTDAEGIEHRRDPGRRDLGVISEPGAARVPHDRRARHEMGFQMIGVQFDEAGQEIIAFEVDGRTCSAALADFGDAARLSTATRAFQDPVGGDDRRH